jgi:2-dehydropantoate 2-reductase
MGIASRDTVAVVGAGAVGTTLAARLAETGHPVLVCGRTPLEQLELTDDRGTRTLPVRWAADPAEVGAVPWVVLATKIQHTGSALPWLAGLSGPGTVVVAAQNGVDHRERLTGVRAELAPALVYINAERTGPGRATARYTERELVLPDDEPGRAAAELFTSSSVRVEVSPDFRTAAWRKLLTNAVANPLSALTGRRLEVLHQPGMSALSRDLLRETVAVGRAEGADLPDRIVEETMDWLLALPEGATSSMLQDRLARRGLEYDGLTGAVVRLAERHGVDVPTSRTVLALLTALAPLPD